MSDHVLKYLRGKVGIEIGAAAQNCFCLDPHYNVSNDGSTDSVYKVAERNSCARNAKVDKVDDGAVLANFGESSWDYIFSSHVFEHFPNPLYALERWCHVLKQGGIVYLIIPKRDFLQQDAIRPLTTYEHLIDDYNKKETADTHDITGCIVKEGHYHVFTVDSLRSFVEEFFNGKTPRLEYVDHLDTDDQIGNGFSLVFKVVK